MKFKLHTYGLKSLSAELIVESNSATLTEDISILDRKKNEYIIDPAFIENLIDIIDDIVAVDNSQLDFIKTLIEKTCNSNDKELLIDYLKQQTEV